jgi:hypothetical protein
MRACGSPCQPAQTWCTIHPTSILMHIMWACGSSSFNSHPTSNCIFYTKHLHLFMTITHYGLSGFAFHSMLLWTTRETNITLLILMSSMSHFKPLIWMGANSSKMITDKSHGSHEKVPRLDSYREHRRAKIHFLSSFIALDFLTMVALIEFLGHYHQSEATIIPCN